MGDTIPTRVMVPMADLCNEVGKRDKKIAALEVERNEWKRRCEAIVKMLHLSPSTIKDNWVGYCRKCWWRGDSRCADWVEDTSGGMQPECPECDLPVETSPSYEHSVAFYARALAIAEGRDNG